jgi:hypothetical protein
MLLSPYQELGISSIDEYLLANEKLEKCYVQA